MAENSHQHDHDPGHAHGHEHGHSHDHDHDHSHDDDTYFIDQLCMVGLSGAFGVICLCLWIFKTFGDPNTERSRMLRMLLTEQFHLYVLLSGIGLVLLSFVRGAILWQQSRDPTFQPWADHDHSPGHHHDHDHAHAHPHEPAAAEQAATATAVAPAPEHAHGPGCGHDHKPGETCDHPHDHPPAAAPDAKADPHHHHDHEHGHHHDHDGGDHDHGWAPWRYVVILVPIILYLLGLPSQTPSITDAGHERFIGDFTSIIYEALPFIVLGVLLAGLLEEFVPQQALAKVVPSNHVLAIAVGALLGLVFPMCECGIIVVMKRLLRKGLPLSVCVAYMLAGPVINVVVMGSTYVAFASYNVEGKNDVLGGPIEVVAWRVGLSYLVAIVTALVVHWQWNHYGNKLVHPSILRGLKHPGADDDANGAPRSTGDRLNNITQTALHDFVDILAFLVLGAVMAAIGKLVIKETDVQELLRDTPGVAILLMMGIAVLFCLCSEADAFVAANFPLFWPDGSKLAFLVLGPMLDLKLLLMYTRVFRARLIYTIVTALVIQVFAYTMVVEAFFGKTHPPESPGAISSPSQEKTRQVASAVTIGSDPLNQLVLWGAAYRKSDKGEMISYKEFWEMALRDDQRIKWNDKLVEVRGQFEPILSNDHAFLLSRLQITCCYSDRTTLRSPALVSESVRGLYPLGTWVKVTGKIGFREDRGAFRTMLIVASAEDIVGPVAPDPDPYVPQ